MWLILLGICIHYSSLHLVILGVTIPFRDTPFSRLPTESSFTLLFAAASIHLDIDQKKA